MDNNYFIASKLITMSVSGKAKVIKQKKNGLYLCELIDGTKFEYPEKELKDAIDRYKDKNGH